MKKKGQKISMIKPSNPPILKVEQKKKTSENLQDQFKGSLKQKSAQKKIINLNIFDKTKNRLKNTLKSTRYKTEMDEQTNKQNLNTNNTFFQDKSGKLKKVLLNEERKMIEKQQNTRYVSQYERKNKTIRRMNLNLQIFKNLRNKSIQKKKNNLITKNQQVNGPKPQISHRIGNKKTLQPERVYGSLQNLRKQRQRSRNSNYQLKSENKNKNLIEQKKTKQKNIILILQQENLVRSSNGNQKRNENEINNEPMMKKNVKKVKRESRLERNQIYRKIFQQKDDSLEKFQIKFQKTNKYDLSREEVQIFGDRFPQGFQKLKLLGRGGFSLVWLGQHTKNKKQFAVKQIITESDHQTHLKQIWFGTLFFEFGGVPKAQFASHPGIKNLSKLYYYFINKKDTWLMYENCGQSLGNSLYDLKRHRLNGQKLYKIVYKPFYNKIRLNQNQIRKIILETAKALDLLALSNIVHSDLKTENILIKQNSSETNSQIIKEVKLIDYGSAFVFNNIRQFSMATPQYMAPEVLNFILHENQLEFIQKLLEYVQNYNNSWVIDVWSLGCVLLEIVSGIPLWMSLKTIVTKPDDNAQVIKEGLFAVEGRHFDLIIRKQIQVIQNIDHYLDQQNYSGINLESDLRALLKRMLSLNPKKRVSPSQIIQFLEQSLESEQSFIYEQGCQKQQI